MTLWWIGNAVLLLVVVPVVVILLRGVLEAAKATTEAVEGLRPAAEAASIDLDAVEMLNTTQQQVSQTVAVVADYGGSLDTVLEDA
jgi:gamma-glutamyl phosphate reductase